MDEFVFIEIGYLLVRKNSISLGLFCAFTGLEEFGFIGIAIGSDRFGPIWFYWDWFSIGLDDFGFIRMAVDWFATIWLLWCCCWFRLAEPCLMWCCRWNLLRSILFHNFLTILTCKLDHKLIIQIDQQSSLFLLTKLSFERIVGWVCRVMKICTVNELFFAFNFLKIIEFEFVLEVCIIK